MTFSRDDLSALIKDIFKPLDSDKHEIHSKLRNVIACLKSKNDGELSRHYTWLSDTILDAFKPDISKHLSKEILREIDSVVESGPHASVLLVLVGKIQSTDNAIVLNHCVQLLENFLSMNGLEEILWTECLLHGEERRILHDELVTVIASLPERLANKLRYENRECFHPAKFVSSCSRAMVATCVKVADDLRNERSRDVRFLGMLLSKLCQCGYGKELWTDIFALVGNKFETDFVLSRVFGKVLSHVPGNTQESVLSPMFLHCPCYGIVDRLLQDSIENESRIKFLLTNKLLLHRYYDSTPILINIFGYLSKRWDIMKETLRNLLQVWSRSSYVKHTSYEQQRYISSAIIAGLAFMPGDIGEFGSFLMQTTLQGVPNYLDSGVQRIRVIGMVLAEIMTKFTTPTGDLLEFEYEETDDSRRFKSLLTLPEEFCQIERMAVAEVINMEENLKPNEKTVEIKEEMPSNSNIEELDSDDDLEPYDTSEDVPKPKVKQPKYIRQCMEGFLSKEDPDTFEMALKHSSNLVRKTPAQAQELAEEFALIVVRTEDQYETENFNQLLGQLLVDLIRANPKRVAERLCEEYYARNYNIKQRLDILDALARAAQSLSKLDTTKQASEEKELASNDATNWREIVDRRIKTKTRRFASAKKDVQETTNKFGPLAGYFFYPLLHPETADPSVDIRGRDSVLLVRMLYTLSMVVHAALNTQIVARMARELLDFVWMFRTHSEAAVRRGVLFAITMVLISVPGFVSLSEMEMQIGECRLWLQHVLADDQDTICRELAKQGLLVFVDYLKQSAE